MKKHFIVVILLIFCAVAIAEDNSSNTSHILGDFMPAKAKQAIWKIIRTDVFGTGFFISPRLLVTNFHVILPRGPLTNHGVNLVLSKPDVNHSLQVSEVMAVSAVHDLAVLEVEAPVAHYLSLVESSLASDDKDFVVMGYPDGDFRLIENLRPVTYFLI